MEKDQFLNTVSSFLKSIGIELREEHFEDATFLQGLKIRNGALLINKQQLIHYGDVLHEAGHIAVTAAAERNILNDNVTENNTAKEGEELAAMLWSYAVCLHLNIAPEIVFHKQGYKGDADWILNNYRNNEFIGLPLLVWMGMTESGPNEHAFPKMKKWLRD